MGRPLRNAPAALLALALASPWARADDGLSATGERWALKLRVVSAADIPVLGAVRSTTVTLGLLEPIPGTEYARYTICDVAMVGASSLVRSRLPEAFVRALPVRTVQARLHEGRFDADLGTSNLGFDPLVSGGRVPVSADDPAVIDLEGDGAPGFTVLVDVLLFPTAEIWIAQASTCTLDGALVSPHRVEGRPAVARLEQHVLGASNRLFARSPVVRSVDGEGSFTLERMPEGAGCAEVERLFGEEGT